MRSGAGYKLAPPGGVRRDHDRRGASPATGPCSFGSASLDLGSVATPLRQHVRGRARRARTRTGSSTSGTRSTTGRSLRVHGAALGRRRDPVGDRHRALGHQGQGARRAGLPAARRRRSAIRVPLLLELRLLVDTPDGAVAPGAGVPRAGLQGASRSRSASTSRTTSRACTRSARTSATTSTCSSTRTSATRATSRCGSAASSRSSTCPSSRSRCSIDDVDGHAFLAEQARRPDRDRREHVHALGLPAVLREAGDPRRRRPTPRAAAASARRSAIADLAGALPPATRSRTRSPTR